MAHLVRCIEGHVFDADENKCCPVCGAVVSLTPPGTAKADDKDDDRKKDDRKDGDTEKRTVASRSIVPWLVTGLSSGVALAVVAFAVWRLLIGPRPQPAPKPPLPQQQAMTTKVTPPRSAPPPASKAQNPQPQAQAASHPHSLHASQPAPKPADQAKVGAPRRSEQAFEQIQAAASQQPAQIGAAHAKRHFVWAPTGSGQGIARVPAPNGSGFAAEGPTAAPATTSRTITAAEISATLDALSRDAGVDQRLTRLARLTIGEKLLLYGKPALGVRILKNVARNGVPAAANDVGTVYLSGKYGLQRDLERAVKWYRVGAEEGNPFAAWNLQYMLAFGQGAPRDYALAGRLLTFTYIAGLPQAEAFIEAARKGNVANLKLLRLFGVDPENMPENIPELITKYIKRDPAKLRSEVERLVAQKNGGAYGELAFLMLYGIGGRADPQGALDNYLLDAAQGISLGLFYAGSIYGGNRIGQPDYADSAVCFELARLNNARVNGQVYDEAKLIAKAELNLPPRQKTAVQALVDLLNRIIVPAPQVAK